MMKDLGSVQPHTIEERQPLTNDELADEVRACCATMISALPDGYTKSWAVVLTTAIGTFRRFDPDISLEEIQELLGSHINDDIGPVSGHA